MWIQDTSGAAEGVILKRPDSTYATLPATLQDSMFHRAIAALNAGAAMTVKSRVISTVVDRLSPDEDSVPINDGQRILKVTLVFLSGSFLHEPSTCTHNQ